MSQLDTLLRKKAEVAARKDAAVHKARTEAKQLNAQIAKEMALEALRDNMAGLDKKQRAEVLAELARS